MYSTRKHGVSKQSGDTRQLLADLRRGLSEDLASTNDRMRRSFLMPYTIARWAVITLRGSSGAGRSRP